jgi:hypothetical protein
MKLYYKISGKHETNVKHQKMKEYYKIGRFGPIDCTNPGK